MGNYFSITPKTAYGSTIYVHSHSRSISYELKKQNYKNALANLVNAIEQAAQSTIDNLDTVIKLLEQRTQEIVDCGYPTKDGKPYGLTDRYKEFNKIMMKFYDLARGAKTQARKKITSKQASDFWTQIENELNSGQLIADILEKINIGPDVADILISRLDIMRNKSKYQKKVDPKLLTKDIASLTAQELAEIFRDKRKKNIVINQSTKDDLTKGVMMARDILQEWKDLLDAAIKYAPILHNPNLNDANFMELYNRVFKYPGQFLPKQGLLEEFIATFMGDIINNDGTGAIVYNSNGSQVIVTQQAIGAKHGMTLGDQITTDIKALLDQSEEVFGISVKLNPAYFLKSNLSLTPQEQEDLIPNWKQLNLNNALVYYLTNFAILSKIEYPRDDKSYRTNYRSTGSMAAPVSGSLKFTSGDLFEKLRTAVVTNLFIKGVVGSLFMASATPKDYNSFSSAIQEQGMPIIIQTSVGQYWSKDLLKTIKKIAMSGKISEIFQHLAKNPLESLSKNVNKIYNNFIELFALKVDYAFKHPVTKDYDGDRYAEIAEEENISDKMKTIVDILWDNNDHSDILQKIMNMNTTIRLKYDDYL